MRKNIPEESTSSASFVSEQTNKVLSSLGIAHTAETTVGDEFIRGVSGGERKRVSLAEVMATEVRRWALETVNGAKFFLGNYSMLG